MAVIDARVNGDTMSPEAKASVTRIRDRLHPGDLYAARLLQCMVTGESAFMVDYDQITNDYTPWIFVFVLSLSFIVLLLAFRSIVIPVTAIIMNLLSVGASYGLIVLVFQKGFLAQVPRLHPGSLHRDLAAALPVRRALRAVHGLPGVPAEPYPRALQPTS